MSATLYFGDNFWLGEFPQGVQKGLKFFFSCALMVIFGEEYRIRCTCLMSFDIFWVILAIFLLR